MINLYQKDIIEYELKMSQFRQQLEEKKQAQHNCPKCAICGSTDLSKITATQKAGKAVLFGLFAAGDMSKTWKCNKCGSKF